MDAIAFLSDLRSRYPKVVIQGRKQKVPDEDVVCVTYWLKGDTVKCRVVKPFRTRYMSVFELEPYLNQGLATIVPKGTKVAKPVITSPRDLKPMKFGKGLITMLGGQQKWVGSKYLAVSLPENAEYMIPSWRGWLKFIDWDGRNPNKRSWSPAHKFTLVSSGMYAWIVAMDRASNNAKVLYSGDCARYSSNWFSLGNGAVEMQRTLVAVNQYADSQQWQLKEASAIGEIQDYTSQEEKKRETRRRYRERKKERIEITRVPDNVVDEFGTDVEGGHWDGDLTHRYVEEEPNE